jgi:hypothetical protein
MPSDTRNVKLGVCTITYGGVDLGYTKGGVEVEVATETKKVMVDQFGNSEIDERIIGRTCKAKVPLAETTLENLVRIMPGATLIGSGGAAATGSVTFVTGAPVNDDKVTINGVDFTFKTVPVGDNDMAIPGSVGAAAAALIVAVNNCIDPLVSEITASAGAAGVVNITADTKGTAGNAVTLAKTAATPANITVSGATLTGGTDWDKVKVEVTNGIGQSLLAIAQKLVLHPVEVDADDRTQDFVMPIAATAGQLNFAFKLDEERTYPVEFTAYPNPSTKVLFVVGDESAVAA